MLYTHFFLPGTEREDGPNDLFLVTTNPGFLGGQNQIGHKREFGFKITMGCMY